MKPIIEDALNVGASFWRSRKRPFALTELKLEARLHARGHKAGHGTTYLLAPVVGEAIVDYRRYLHRSPSTWSIGSSPAGRQAGHLRRLAGVELDQQHEFNQPMITARRDTLPGRGCRDG